MLEPPWPPSSRLTARPPSGDTEMCTGISKVPESTSPAENLWSKVWPSWPLPDPKSVGSGTRGPGLVSRSNLNRSGGGRRHSGRVAEAGAQQKVPPAGK